MRQHRRHIKQERCDKIQALQLHVPRGHTAQGSCRVEQERDNTSRGSNNGNTAGRKHVYGALSVAVLVVSLCV